MCNVEFLLELETTAGLGVIPLQVDVWKIAMGKVQQGTEKWKGLHASEWCFCLVLGAVPTWARGGIMRSKLITVILTIMKLSHS